MGTFTLDKEKTRPLVFEIKKNMRREKRSIFQFIKHQGEVCGGPIEK